MNHGLMNLDKIRMGWDEMRIKENPTSPEELKEGMELEGWRILCVLCDAEMWVHISIDGEKHLMRQGTIPYEICPICSEIHRVAQS